MKYEHASALPCLQLGGEAASPSEKERAAKNPAQDQKKRELAMAEK